MASVKFISLLKPNHNEKPLHEARVSFALPWWVQSNRGLLSLAENLHDRLQSPQDPYVVVVLSSLLPELRLLRAFPLGWLP